MPPKRKYSSTKSASSSSKKKRVKYASTGTMSRPKFANLLRQQLVLGKGPVPPSVIVNLKYCAGFQTDGSNYDNVFNLNSLFDPEQTGTGHQPLGRDQYNTFYNRYRVLKVRVKLIFQGDPVVVSAPQVVGLVADNSQSIYTDMDTALEQQGAYHTLTGGYGGACVTIVRNYDLAKITGVTAAAYKDDRFQMHRS